MKSNSHVILKITNLHSYILNLISINKIKVMEIRDCKHEEEVGSFKNRGMKHFHFLEFCENPIEPVP